MLGTLDEGASCLERGRTVIAIFFTYLICLQAPYWQNTFELYAVISALYQWSQDELR